MQRKLLTIRRTGDEAYEAHQKSVVLLKNKDQVLPLTADKLEGKTVYVEYFSQKENPAQTEALRKNLAEKYGIQVTEDYNQADYAILFVNPKSGNYFSATAGYLELDICDGKIVHDVDELGRPGYRPMQKPLCRMQERLKKLQMPFITMAVR